MLKILVVVPAYNEEESLEKTIASLRSTVPNCDYLVVNDGSTDSTAEICRKNSYPFIDLPLNLGLSGAFQAGMKYAQKHGYQCAVQFDADGQHLPEYVMSLAEATKDYDIAIGSRFIRNKKPKSMRMMGSSLIEWIIKITTGCTITDPTSGMRAFNSRMISLLASDFNYGPEPDTVSCLIKREGAKVVEIPVEMSERMAGESYLTLKRSMLYMLRMTISIMFIQLFRR